MWRFSANQREQRQEGISCSLNNPPAWPTSQTGPCVHSKQQVGRSELRLGLNSREKLSQPLSLASSPPPQPFTHFPWPVRFSRSQWPLNLLSYFCCQQIHSGKNLWKLLAKKTKTIKGFNISAEAGQFPNQLGSNSLKTILICMQRLLLWLHANKMLIIPLTLQRHRRRAFKISVHVFLISTTTSLESEKPVHQKRNKKMDKWQYYFCVTTSFSLLIHYFAE